MKNITGKEGYTERGMNTFNDLPKNKSTQTERILHSDASAGSSIWQLYDTYASLQGLFVMLRFDQRNV